jgi:phosphoglycolate phosphatase-like HAD superfamily hydrolase
MNKKVLIYDFDGVICDSVDIKTEAFCQMYQEYGDEIVNQVKLYHLENGGISRFEKFKYYHNKLLDIKIDNKQINDLSTKFSNIVLDNIISSNLILGAYNFLKNKSPLYSQYICTGTPQKEIEIILNKKNLSIFFNGIYGSPKTKDDIIMNIISNENCSREDVLFFGDAATDYLAAEKCRIDFIAINANKIFPNALHSFKNFQEMESCQLF